MTSVREIVSKIQDEVYKSEELLPDRAAELLVKLSSIYGNILEEIREAEKDYNQVLLLALDTEEKANRAKIKAETSPAYDRLKIARNTEKIAIEITRSLKHYLRVKEQEFKI